MTLKKNILTIGCSLLAILTTITTAQTVDFSGNYDEFVEQMDNIFKQTPDKKKAKTFIDELSAFMQSEIDKGYKDQLIICCNAERQRKAKAYPNYFNCINTFIKLSKTDKLSSENYKVWWSILENKISQKKTRLSEITNYLSMIDNYIDDYTISDAPSARWKIDTPNAKFRNVKSQLIIDIPETRIVCLSQHDSIEVFNTSGSFNTESHKWNGEYGQITWERCGLPSDKVWATFKKYKIDMTKSTFTVDSATFNNNIYFNSPLIGTIEHKALHITNEKESRYPKFYTTYERYNIENIFPHINYNGGFAQNGASFLGSKSPDKPAIIEIYRNDTLFIEAHAPSFMFFIDRIETQEANIQINLDDESITHPCLRFRYDDSKKEVHMIRGNNGLEKSRYIDTFHKLNMDIEFIKWNVNSTDVELGMIDGAAQGLSIYESTNYYREEYFNQLQGMELEHPFQNIINFYKFNGGQAFTIADYAAYRGLSESSIRQMMMRLAFDGFIDYDSNYDIANPTERLFDYIEYRLGKKDFDVIRFTSESTTGKRASGVLDLKNYDIQLIGVTDVSISDNQNIFFFPSDGKITIKRNRDFKFDGKIEAGMLTLEGSGFYFSYDNYRIELNKIEEMNLKIATGEIDLYGRKKYENVNNSIHDLSGYLEIDEPDNKSGRRFNPQYPRLTSTKESYVYFDAPEIQNGNYKRDKFYYAVDPFVFESVNNITFDHTSFEGTLTSNIFPPIRQNLIVRDKDNSLGFQTSTPQEGYPIYNGRATFYNGIDLSNAGLHGNGDLVYIQSKSSSQNFLFLLDETNGFTTDFNITETDKNVTFPSVELGKNQTGRTSSGETKTGQSWLQFKPQNDYMNISNTIGEFCMFANTNTLSGFDCKMSGKLQITPKGLSGVGKTSLPQNAKMEAAIMDFTNSSIVADTVYFAQYKYSQLLQKDSLQSDGLRKDILEGDTTIRASRERQRIYSTTAAKHPEKSFHNNALRENAIFDDIYNTDENIKDLIETKSMLATIDFKKREGYFTYKNIAGGEKTYTSIKYKTWVRQFTWDMDKNTQVIGQKGSLPGLRFVCTKERKDSLSFYVPYAQFNANDDVLYCEEVKYINTADARVNLDKEGKVVIHTNAVMDALDNSNIDLKTETSYHHFYDTKVNIEGAKKYHAFGYYNFTNKNNDTIPVFMSEISADSKGVTNTKGSVSDEIKIDDHFAYKGNMNIRAGRQLLEFNGAARMIHNSKLGPKGFVRFDAIIDPQLVLIPIGDKITNWNNDEIYMNFFLKKDSSHVYSSFIESRKEHSDIELIYSEGLLFYNNIFERFDVTSDAKRQKPDTTGVIMSFIPDEDILTGYGPVRTGLCETENSPMDIVTAGNIKHDRKTNTITLSTLMQLNFHFDNGLVTHMYTDILNSKAEKCDSTSKQFIARLSEILDTTTIKFIEQNRVLPLVKQKDVLELPDFGDIFTFDNVELLWNSKKHAYICDTIVDLVMMRERNVCRKIKMKAEFGYHKTGNNINILLTADANTWFFFSYKNGQMQVLSSDKDFITELKRIDPKERRSRARGTTYLVAPDSRLKKFVDNFGIVSDNNNVEDDDEIIEETEEFIDDNYDDTNDEIIEDKKTKKQQKLENNFENDNDI